MGTCFIIATINDASLTSNSSVEFNLLSVSPIIFIFLSDNSIRI